MCLNFVSRQVNRLIRVKLRRSSVAAHTGNRTEQARLLLRPFGELSVGGMTGAVTFCQTAFHLSVI